MDPDDILPPPAYSEQEFDQKISQATTLSLNTPQSYLTNVDPDGWPEYDPAAFETTTASEGSSSSPTHVERSSPFPTGTSLGKKDDYMQSGIINDRPSVVPLRIEKKKQQRSNLPNQLAIYQPTNESSTLTIDENPMPPLFYPATIDRDDFRSQLQIAYAEDDNSFMSLTTAAPVDSTQMTSHHRRNASIPSMPPQPPFEAQRLALPTEPNLPAQPFYGNHYQQHVDPYNITPSQSPRPCSLIQPRPRFVPQERSYSPSTNNFQVPRLDFNPSIAYGKTQPVDPSLPIKQPVKTVQYDPHAFYNSAVSAQITPIATGQHGHTSYPSYNFRNSSSPQRQYQQHGSPATYSRHGPYSQSFVSQDPLSLEISSSSFERNSSRPSVFQSPARPSSSYSISSNYQAFNASPSPAYQYVNHTANVPGNIYFDQQSAESR